MKVGGCESRLVISRLAWRAVLLTRGFAWQSSAESFLSARGNRQAILLLRCAAGVGRCGMRELNNKLPFLATERSQNDSNRQTHVHQPPDPTSLAFSPTLPASKQARKSDGNPACSSPLSHSSAPPHSHPPRAATSRPRSPPAASRRASASSAPRAARQASRPASCYRHCSTARGPGAA